MRLPRAALACGLVGSVACAPNISPNAPNPVNSSAPAIELVESWPLETSLDHADIRDAKDVWLAMIERAKTRLDFAEYYASENPAGPSALTPIILAVERAAARGVKVRFLADAKFATTYPEVLARFEKAGVLVRRFDVHATMGGVLHAKYFLTDDDAYLGSQNFDWRSLEHIQELGVRLTTPELRRALEDVFELDWAIAGGAAHHVDPQIQAPNAFPIDPSAGRVSFVASPKGWLPDERLWDLPALVQLIDSATQTVRVQLLTYQAHAGRGGDFPDLEAALMRAAARGVTVSILVSDWSKHPQMIADLNALHAPTLTVKFLTIPQASSGFIPFARVAHAKYLVVDGARAWVGTSNWEREYFYGSRNVGVVIEGGPLPARLDTFFDDNWRGNYAETLDPTRTYSPPRVRE